MVEYAASVIQNTHNVQHVIQQTVYHVFQEVLWRMAHVMHVI